MTKRERILATIKHELPDKIPTHFINIDEISPYLQYYNLADKEDLADKIGVCIRRIWPDYKKALSEEEANRLNTGLYEDLKPIGLFGTSGGVDSYSAKAGHLIPFANIKTAKEIEKYKWPDPDDWDFSKISDKIDKYNNQYAIMLGSWNPIFDQVLDFFAMDKAMEYLCLQPKLIEATIAHIEDFYLKFYRKYFKAANGKADIFSMGDDFAGQSGMLISPNMWKKYLKPTYTKIFALAKEFNLYVWFHSCGAIEPVIEDLIDIGMDVWETVQAHLRGNEPEYIKNKYGKYITFFGAINTQKTLPFGTPEEVRKEVKDRIKIMGKNGGYICGPDHHIKPHFPIENVIAMIDEIESFRGEDYTI
jgi:uroporphyrinogen decarboxylase